MRRGSDRPGYGVSPKLNTSQHSTPKDHTSLACEYRWLSRLSGAIHLAGTCNSACQRNHATINPNLALGGLAVVLCSLQRPRQPHVAQLDRLNAGLADQHVARGNVPVHDLAAAQVCERVGDLLQCMQQALVANGYSKTHRILLHGP